MILEIQDTLVSMDIITEMFCCDLEKCHGQCCVEGNAGAPVTLEEVGYLEDALDEVWSDLSASAQAVIDKQGVAYVDQEGDLVTSIVNGKDCVFTCYDKLTDNQVPAPQAPQMGGCLKNDSAGSMCCLCAIERAKRKKNEQNISKNSSPRGGREGALGASEGSAVSTWTKPISCALYPIRVKQLKGGITALNYNRWDICKDAVVKGQQLHLPVYKFLRGPLIRRFGQEWYDELCLVAKEIEKQGIH